ncbi:MAG: 3-phosphoshikimate 1-carboxyvinyltransferase [Vicinamibacterales bacterium]
MTVARATEVRPARALRGALEVPSDKSIAHRYALLAALADGDTTIDRYSTGADCLSSLSCLEALGVAVARRSTGEGLQVRITGTGGRFAAPAGDVDCGNSGTTMRLLAGLLAAAPLTARLVGDASLSRRPMRRVITPLMAMGATIDADEGGRPPLVITGGPLTGIVHTPEVPSAQIKSAVLLAGLRAAGTTTVIEPAPTRDHTERALAAFGAPVDLAVPGRLTVRGGTRLSGGLHLRVPGDPSACAFLGVAAAGLPGSAVEIRHVGLNPTRTALFDVLRRAGADVVVTPADAWHGEPVGAVRIASGHLGDIVITPAEVPLLIDELPALAALATFGGSCTVRGAAELRVKESDRIAALVAGLRAMGADADEFADGFAVRGGRRLAGGTVDAHHDHRLAMAFAVAALGATGPTAIVGAEVAAVSFPHFFATLDGLRA